jgi:hypothetical protein
VIVIILYKTKDMKNVVPVSAKFRGVPGKGIKVSSKNSRQIQGCFLSRGDFAGKDMIPKTPQNYQKLPQKYKKIMKAIAVNPRKTRRELALKKTKPDGIKNHRND